MEQKVNSEIKKEYIENYFFSKKPQPVTLNTYIYSISAIIFFSAVSLLVFQSKSIAILTGATIGLLIFRLVLYPYKVKNRQFEMRAPDKSINKWFIEDLKIKIKQKAIDHLLLHDAPLSDEQFIIIPYPVFHSTRKINDEDLLRVSTKDGYYSYSVWNVQVLVLGTDYLSYYFCTYNWLQDTILNEKSNEFFYEDIALVKNDIEQVNFASKWNDGILSEAHILKLINVSGDFLYLVTELPELKQAPETIINQETIVQVFRILLRQIRKNRKPKNEPLIQFPTGTAQTDEQILVSA